MVGVTITCGWCGHPTATAETRADHPANLPRCSACGHEDPARPWTQRGQEPPTVNAADKHRKALHEAEAAIRAEGLTPTVDRIAERLDITPRNVRRWRADVRSAT